MPEMKRNVKGSVFTYLFSDPRYARELYLYLHPEDMDVSEEECKIVTTEMLFSQEEVREIERRYIMKEGMERGMLLAITGLMESTGMTAENAMASLKIATPDRPRYMELLNQPKQ